MGWLEFGAAMAAFLLAHALPVRPGPRAAIVAALGKRGFGLGYSALSILLLGWLIGAAARAPYLPLWDFAPWQAALPWIVMALVCPLIAFGAARPNPFSFGGRNNDAFEPSRPGVVRWLRHPLLAALALWSGAHLVANGDLAHVLMFGTFTLFALSGMVAVDTRRRRMMGSRWEALRDAVAAGPILPRPLSVPGAILRVAVSAGLYALFRALHPVISAGF